MINSERLKSIKELNPGQWHEGDAAAESYTARLTAFTDEFPDTEEQLRDALALGDVTKITQCAAVIRDKLFTIGADRLASDCFEKINEFPIMASGSLEAYIESFLGSVSALSVDIQMAIYGDGQTAPGQPAGDGGRTDREFSILAVDDNAFFLNTIKSYLQGTPYKLTCVNAGSVALRFLDKRSPDLFILDIDMPEMDGYELAEKIREKGGHAPIIFLTGNASKEYVLKAVKAGASDFIIKPISKQQALDKIAKYV